jgi:hypothetical protein
MTPKTKFHFTRTTLKFGIAGIFIPGFTAIAILVPVTIFRALGVECYVVWTSWSVLTTIGAIIAPVIFLKMILKRLAEGHRMTTASVIIFNLTEYTFLQCMLAVFFSSSETRCYGTDGQNGLEFAFTGWIAIPFLILMSLLFDHLVDKRTRQLNAD